MRQFSSDTLVEQLNSVIRKVGNVGIFIAKNKNPSIVRPQEIKDGSLKINSMIAEMSHYNSKVPEIADENDHICKGVKL